ncbi:hypothetical protein PFI31113_04976 [Pandoraea fibrosis]|uniref:Uncharacterized protein n=1 Tax=Pandoraea fibrosis TaxID=1891094 RepID=A0A5E4Z406_9BURK|nr:hypothetical protein PFI31113_04976 [Pandoraea fibrosis]
MLVRTRRLQRHGREHLATDRTRGQFTHRHAIDRGQHRALVGRVATVGCQEVDDVPFCDLRARLGRGLFRSRDDRIRLFTAGDATNLHFTADHLGISVGLHDFELAHDILDLDIVRSVDHEFRIGEIAVLRDMDLAAGELALDLLETRLDLRACFRRISAHLELVHAQIERAVVLQALYPADIRAQRDSARLGDVHSTRTQCIGVGCRQHAALHAQAFHAALIARQRQVAGTGLDHRRAGRLGRRHGRAQSVRIVLRRRLYCRMRDLALEVIVLAQFAEHQHGIARHHVALASQ